MKERKAIERRIRDLSTGNPEDISKALETKEVFNLLDIILDNVVGRSLCHVWYDEDGQDKVVYSGKFQKLKRSITCGILEAK